MANNRSYEEMLGETLREIGVLIVVFFPLDHWFTFHTFAAGFVLASALLSLIFIGGGMWVERNRRR